MTFKKRENAMEKQQGKHLQTPVSSHRRRNRKREVNLDLIRAVAAFLVISVHFFMNIGYYNQPLEGKRMLLMTVARMGFMTCVPLFLILSGYLCRKKELNVRYYLGLIRTMLTYTLCALCCIVVQLERKTLELKGVCDLLGRLLDFSADPYAWYIEMYIGLFLLIPFLNLIWKGLETKGRRWALVLTLLVTTALPTLSNLPALSDVVLQKQIHYSIIPDFWISIYPITYYFLGAWFGEYQPKVDWRWALPALIGVTLAGGGIFFYLLQGKIYRWNVFTDWGGATVTVSACLLFLLLRQIPANRFPRWLQWLCYKGSELSLGIYLISWCFDTEFYPTLLEKVPLILDRLPWYFVIVPVIYLCSAGAAQMIEWFRRGIVWLAHRVFLDRRAR